MSLRSILRAAFGSLPRIFFEQVRGAISAALRWCRSATLRSSALTAPAGAALRARLRLCLFAPLMKEVMSARRSRFASVRSTPIPGLGVRGGTLQLERRRFVVGCCFAGVAGKRCAIGCRADLVCCACEQLGWCRNVVGCGENAVLWGGARVR